MGRWVSTPHASHFIRYAMYVGLGEVMLTMFETSEKGLLRIITSEYFLQGNNFPILPVTGSVSTFSHANPSLIRLGCPLAPVSPVVLASDVR